MVEDGRRRRRRRRGAANAHGDDDENDDDDDGHRWRKYGEKMCHRRRGEDDEDEDEDDDERGKKHKCERRSYYKCAVCAECPARKRMSVDARGRRRVWYHGAHRHPDADADDGGAATRTRTTTTTTTTTAPKKRLRAETQAQAQAQARHARCAALDVNVPVKKRQKMLAAAAKFLRRSRDGDDANEDDESMVELPVQQRAKEQERPSLDAITTRVTLSANPRVGERSTPKQLLGVKFFAHLEGPSTSKSGASPTTMLRPVRVLAMTPTNAAHLKHLLVRSTVKARAQSNWAPPPPPIRPPSPLAGPPPASPPTPQQHQQNYANTNTNQTSNTNGGVFVDYGVYKTKGALKVKCVKAQFERDAGGRAVLKRAGGVLFELANSTAPRQYDWSNKSSFMLSATEAAELADRMAANAGCSFFHDPGAGTSARGATNKKFVVEPMPDGSGGLFVNVSVTSKSGGGGGGDGAGAKSFHSVPVSYGESAAIRHLIVYLVPRLMGFDELFSASA